MIELNAIQTDKIKAATLAAFPREMCGVLTDDDFIQIDNIHNEPEHSFTMHSLQWGEAVDQAVAVVHSHVKKPEHQLGIDTRTPSGKDVKYQKLSGLPWLIVATEGQNVTPPVQIPREPSAKYEGREFIWYINDCFTLVIDYYKFQLDIDLPENVFDAFNDDISQVIAEYAEQHGFYDVMNIDEIQNGDILVLNSLGLQENHLGVYLDGMVLHQMQTSRFDPFKNHIGRINRILRYGR